MAVNAANNAKWVAIMSNELTTLLVTLMIITLQKEFKANEVVSEVLFQATCKIEKVKYFPSYVEPKVRS
jgi:hypothetical protein